MNKIFKIFFYLLSPIIILIILLIKPFKNIRFSLQSSERLGDFATHMEVYLSENKISILRKNLDIFVMTDIISNKTYLSLLKKKVVILPNFITYPIFHVITLLSHKFKLFKDFILKTKFEDNNFSIINSNCNLTIEKTFIEKGNIFLNSLNIPKDAKIICLIVRDNAYLKKKFPKKNWDYHNYRNSNINNYKEAINAATERGYYVFRMGEITEQELKLNNNEKFIDYSTYFRTDFLDIFLAYKCNFCITTGTGWDCIPAFTFRKPTVWTNYTPVGNMNTYSENFLFSIKTHYDKVKKKKMTLKEISESFGGYANSSDLFKKSNILLEENSPEDLRDLTIEMIDKLEGNLNIEDEDEQLQKTFWSKYVEYFMLKNLKPEISSKLNPLWCTTQRLYNKKIISRIGINFLRKNKFLIE